MCLLCVVQKWSRRVIKALPWLVIPLIGLWAFSQFLAPGLQFEITSPRLACVVVLLVTVFWYEVLLPQLTSYWARRSARIREQQRLQSLKLQKLRKTATRRCRNCFTPYREQNPGGGKFMCSYCGHVSRRPVLDLPGPPGRSGFISSLVGIYCWFCSQDYSTDGSENYVSPFPLYWGMNSEEQFLHEESYSRAAVFTWKLILSFFSCGKRFYRRVLRFGSYTEDGFSDTGYKGLSRKGENGVNCFQEDKGERARRKAEEKRQARLEKEMLEEEERKQREEVARLIEERRKLRDENLEAEKEGLKGRASDGERDNKREYRTPDGERDNRKESEPEKRRRDKKEEQDKSSSRSSSDGEGHEKRGIREIEKKHGYERKGETKKGDASNPRTENQKINIEVANSVKDVANKSKHLDRMRGALLSSSRNLNGIRSFGKGSHNSAASMVKSGKPSGALADHTQRRGEDHSVKHVNGRSLSNGDPKVIGTTYPQHTQTGTLKRSWHKLFTSPSASSPSPHANVMERLNQIVQSEVQISQSLDQKLPGRPLHKQMQFGQSSSITVRPFMSSYLTGSSASLGSESRFSLAGELGHNSTREGVETFKDPCYVPDPITLIGPVSESLDNFVDFGSGFTADIGSDVLHILKNVSDSADAKKPSPIEAPMPKLRLFEERDIVSGSCTQDHDASLGDESTDIDQGTWQMWSSPLCQDLLGLVAAPSSGLSAPRQNRGAHEEIMHPLAHNPVASHAVKEKNIFQSTFNRFHNVHVGYCQNGDMTSSMTPVLAKDDPWLQGSVLHPFPGDAGNHFNFIGNPSQNEVVPESPKGSAASQIFELLPAHYWSKGLGCA